VQWCQCTYFVRTRPAAIRCAISTGLQYRFLALCNSGSLKVYISESVRLHNCEYLSIISAMARVVSLISTKGGVGKTVSAIHIAAQFSAIGKTLLVDGDATRSATLWSKPGRLPFKVIPERQLSKELTESQYGFVVLDTEANPTDADIRELAVGSDLAIIPAIPDALCLHAVLQTAHKIGQFAPNTPYRVLLTIVPPRPNRDGLEAEIFLDEHKLPRFKSTVRRLVAFPRCVMAGVTVEQIDRQNLGSRDYERVGQEVLDLLGIHIPTIVGGQEG